MTDSFGDRLKACRKTAGLSQAEFGAKVDLSRSSVSNIEAGRQRSLLDDVERFAAVLGVEPAWLAFGRVTVGGPPPPRPPLAADLLACSNDLQVVAVKLTGLAYDISEGATSEEA